MPEWLNELPLWMWIVGGCGFALIGFLLGARRERPIIGVVLGLLGPVGWLLLLVVPFPGDIRCPGCGKRTWSSPPPKLPLPEGQSYPHMRCRRCHCIIPD